MYQLTRFRASALTTTSKSDRTHVDLDEEREEADENEDESAEELVIERSGDRRD